uniref:Immunoglobulin subtype domain-containing protein n=1 Tax=Sinocyclocheilus grahami TaxID=75366 RepID=A0A672MR74_SINGR
MKNVVDEYEITVKTGKPLKMSVLFPNADKVEKNSSGAWREVWSRTDGVQSDRLNVTDGNLIIKAFTASDAGTYRVLDSKEKTLITVTVTGEKLRFVEMLFIKHLDS